MCYILCFGVDTCVMVKSYFTWALNLKRVTYSFPASSGDLIADNQETSSLIKRCTKGPLILSIWQLGCTRRPLSCCHYYWWNVGAGYQQQSLFPFCLCFCSCFQLSRVSLRKSSTDARWPNDLCLATDAWKAVFQSERSVASATLLF